MKRCALVFLTFIVIGISTAYGQNRGGIEPCLATIFMGDTRIGLYMNEGKPIEDLDWIRFVGNFVPYVDIAVPVYTSYKYAYPTSGISGCAVSYLWGHRVGKEYNNYRLRTKEWLLCIPCVNIYPCVAITLEAYSGKTFTEVVQEEGLAR